MPTILVSTITTNPTSIDVNSPSSPTIIQQVLDIHNESDADKAEREDKVKADKIDAYYKSRKMKLAGHGDDIVAAARKYDFDPYVLAAIATKETTGGNFACPKTYKVTKDIRYTYNVFGWGSCSIKFESYRDAFETLAKNLSGNNPNTSKHYMDKDVVGILESYNPRHIVKDYPEQILAIIDDIQMTDIDTNSSKEIAMK